MNPWDTLSATFDVHKNQEEIDPGAADNILIAWPPIIELITSHFSERQSGSLTAIDYGCGTGGFTQKLHSLGFTVTGADNSEGMLAAAKESLPNLTFINSDHILQDATYDLITGIMVFQFIEDIEETLQHLIKRLNDGGLFVFAVFNPKFVRSCLKVQKAFSDFDSLEDPHEGVLTLGESQVKTFIRSAADYAALLSQFDLIKRLEAYPPFTKEYLAAYPVDRPVEESEYLILGYSCNEKS